MARPRRPYNGSETIQFSKDGHDFFWRQYAPPPPPNETGRRMKDRWKAMRHKAHRAVNGLYDPLTYWQVLDVIASIDPDIELRTNKLVDFLQHEREQFYWDVITVGKIVSDICDEFEEALGAKNGLLERGKDYKGNFYRIHINEETIRLVYKVRDELMDLAEDEMRKRLLGQPTPRLVSPLQEVPALRGAFADPNIGA